MWVTQERVVMDNIAVRSDYWKNCADNKLFPSERFSDIFNVFFDGFKHE